MSLDFPPPDNSAFDPALMERVEIVEALPFTREFEQIMYHRRALRLTEHVMSEPIVLHPTLLDTRFPPELVPYITSSHCVIDNLRAYLRDPQNGPASLDIRFTADSKAHTLQTTDGGFLHHAESYSMDDITHTVGPHVGVALLAALAYARQYNERDPTAAPTFVESQLDVPRDPELTLAEQLLMTLGHHDGQSTITTSSVFTTPTGETLMARLAEGEFPRYSSLQSKLELAEVISLEESSKTNLHQNVVNIPVLGEPMTLEERFAEHHEADELTFIDPTRDYAAWTVICDRFLTAIEPDLKDFASTDEQF